MTNEEIKNMCLALLHADSETEVIKILTDKGFWGKEGWWRYYGDKDTNFSTIGNQGANPEQAIAEKLINSVDAVLMSECWKRGIKPSGVQAPNSIREAVVAYFGDGIERLGNIYNWTSIQRRNVSRRITVAATGSRLGNPCFTISDDGEGQTPAKMPHTLLSLDHKNKADVRFVQGMFNMGGTGVLRFCSINHNLEFVLSKRNPDIFGKNPVDDTNHLWGFTVIRRENAPPGEKNSIYTYLAPINAETNPRNGELLSFYSEELPIFPVENRPYARNSKCGTLIKLYEYQASGFRSNILRSDGLLSKLDIILPEIALPVRMHECREFGGVASRSFETTMAGLCVRLDEDRSGNLEAGFPDAGPFMVQGQPLLYTVYAFKPDKAKTYKTKREGILFVINGQTHAMFTSDFFARTGVKKGRIKDSILVMVDCSGLEGRIREDLFPNSRDRLSRNAFRYKIEEQLESILFHHQGLRDLSEKRRREEFESAIAEDKPLAEALKSILKNSPTLSSLFFGGHRIQNPFKTKTVASSDESHVWNQHPTYFKFQKLKYGEELSHSTPKNSQARIIFETDVVNDYFVRSHDRGKFTLYRLTGEDRIEAHDFILTLREGRAVLTLKFPEGCVIGQQVQYEATVTDPTMITDFKNDFIITVVPEREFQRRSSTRAKPPTGENGQNREIPSGLSIPDIREVREGEWGKYGFDRFTALQVKQEDVPNDEAEEASDSNVYTYYINVDNVYLKYEAKNNKISADVLTKRFVYGMALMGMSLIRAQLMAQKKGTEDNGRDDQANGGLSIEETVKTVSSSLAPILLPLIEQLGSLTEDSPVEVVLVGDEE